MAAVISTHFEIDEQGIAWITGANVKVIEVALDKVAYGWSPEEMHSQHPNLSLAQIHSALAYYYEHQERLDAEMSRQERELEALAAQTPNRFSRRQLLARKNNPG